MIIIHSPVKEIETLRIEAPSGKVRITEIVHIGRLNGRYVAIGEDGTLYTNELRDKAAYVFGSRVAPFLSAAVKLGAIRRKHLTEHMRLLRVRDERQERSARITKFFNLARKFGVVLTKSQKRKVNAA